jgi:hypothetical protein
MPYVGKHTWYGQLVAGLEGAYFGIVAFSIAISGIFGGVALSYILVDKGPTWQLVASIGLVLANMILPVAQQKLKPIISLFLLSIVANSVLILIHFF